MRHMCSTFLATISVPLTLCGAFAATEDLGNGFFHHGVATPASNHRGTVATADGQGRNVVLVWLFDHRGGYAILMIDADTGKAEEIRTPFPPGGDCPYASILSSANKYYTHFNSHFVEFDPAQRAFTFFTRTAPQMAMSMTEDDNGVIWSATYPSSGVVSFNPKTREFKDYGHLYQQNWAQYPRAIATDDAGWVYFGIGSAASQILVLDPQTGKATPVLPEEERIKAHAYVYRDKNGKVYGHNGSGNEWYEFYKGQWKKIGRLERQDPKPYIAGSQGLFHRNFPDGKQLQRCDLTERLLVVADPKTGQEKRFRFDYSSEGAHIMGVAAAPNGTICGGTAFPMCFFSYNPKTDQWVNRPCYGQWNTVAPSADRFFVGAYSSGSLLEWDPAREWVPTEARNEKSNPRLLTECSPTIIRPTDLLVHPDGRTLVLAGTPAYGHTGGGLLFWNRETGEGTLLDHTQLLPNHSTMSLVALPGGKLLGGTTTSPGTGGIRIAKEAELYILDMATKKIEWHEAVFPGVQGYTDMIRAPDGLVYGFADQRLFFVFDAAQRKVIHQEDTGSKFGPTTSAQGPRVFVQTPKKEIYILFVRGIARVEPGTFAIQMVAESPVPIGPGGDYLDGRIYFANGSHLYSYRLPE